MTRPVRLAALAAATALTAALVPAGPATSATTKSVRLSGVEFSPKTVRISKGSKVKFLWRDNGIVHNVTPVGSRTFKLSVKGRTRSTSGNRTTGTVTTLAFKKAGTYRYICTIHATADENGRFPAGAMTGKVVVK